MNTSSNRQLRSLLKATALAALFLGSPACRSNPASTSVKEPWAKQSRREIERDWWLQNRYDDTRPSALNPGEHR